MSYQTVNSRRLNATFSALADPTRRAILTRLASGEATVNDLAKPFKMSQPAISKHLRVLEKAGLISTMIDAQRRPRRIEAIPLKEANAWIEKYRQFWELQCNRRADFLAETKVEDKIGKGRKKSKGEKK